MTLESLFFSTPEQKLVKLLLSEPTVSFTPRVICSKLKGIRGLGGTEGVVKILEDFRRLGLVDFVSHHRAVRIQDENATVRILKLFVAVCNFESLRDILEPLSAKGVLILSKNAGKGSLDEEYDLFVVSESPDEIKKAAGRHPLGRSIELIVWTPELYLEIQNQNPSLSQKVANGIILWGNAW